ncbi:MAG TPA: hypothetical protein VF708_08570 [Pyrinomonadaceae bacterium]|jgi:hypothetical protein
MFSKNLIAIKAVALLLAFCVAPVFGRANLIDSSMKTEVDAAQNDAPLSGKLMTSGKNLIQVNGNPSPAGTTIFSGAQLVTPVGVEASVDLGSLGILELQPNTKLTLVFNETNIDVKIFYGCATLTAYSLKIDGSITSPHGDTIRTTADRRRLDVCYKEGDAALTMGPGNVTGAGASTASGGLFGLSTTAAIAIIGGTTAVIALIIAGGGGTRGQNPSLQSPLGL